MAPACCRHGKSPVNLIESDNEFEVKSSKVLNPRNQLAKAAKAAKEIAEMRLNQKQPLFLKAPWDDPMDLLNWPRP